MEKKQKILSIFISFIFIILLFNINVFAEEEFSFDNIYYKANVESNTELKVKLSKIDNEYYLFLPSSADMTNLNLINDNNVEVRIYKDGKQFILDNTQTFNVDQFCLEKPTDGIYTFGLIVYEQGIGIQYTLNIMKSENIDSMFIVSDDLSKGRDYIESDEAHNAKAKGSVALLKSDNTTIYDGELKEIKGRGNSSWAKPKKPYQIKFDKKQDLLENGEKSKKWILLANYVDASLIHNEISYNLAKEMGLENSPDCKTIDLYYDGEYRGTYLLSEKVEIGDGRVEIDDLEEAFEEANPDVDMDDLPTSQATTSNGALYQYVEDLNNPENINGGYLIELDNAYYGAEKSWVKVSSGNYFVVKSPEYTSNDGMLYISEFLQEIDDCIKNNGINPNTGKKLEEYVDIESFAKYILVQEFIKNWDFFASSTFFYKPADEDKLYAGPIWDCDGALGVRCDFENYTSPQGFMGRGWSHYLLDIPVIKEEIKAYFNNTLEPIVNNILLGNESGQFLKSINTYVDSINASQKMNYKLWDIYSEDVIIDFNSYEESIEYLRNFIVERTKWIKEEFNNEEENDEENDNVDEDLDEDEGKNEEEDTYNLIICNPVFFDAKYYESLYPDLKNAYGENYEGLYEHYILCGIREGRQASRVFNAEFYINYYPDLKQAFNGNNKYVEALNHFMNFGIKEGRRGSLEFSQAYYRQTYKDLDNAFGDDLKQYYIHYCLYGAKEKRIAMPNIVITDGFFFDAKWYAEKYSDLKEAFGNNYVELYKHYILCGIKEGRQGSAVFDPKEYINTYEDLEKSFVGENKYTQALEHFWIFGIREGRIGSQDFNVQIYRKNNIDLEKAFNTNLLDYYIHYLNYGIYENRICK